MSEKVRPEWEPASEALLKDQIAGYDQVRSRCPVAHSESFTGPDVGLREPGRGRVWRSR